MGSGLEVRTATFPNEAETTWVARLWAHEATAEWAQDEAAERIEMIVSELVANAVLHGEGDIEVGLVRRPEGIEVSVDDYGAGEVEVRDPDESGPIGRGLPIVEALATRWGVYAFEDRQGKRVWADVALGKEPEQA